MEPEGWTPVFQDIVSYETPENQTRYGIFYGELQFGNVTLSLNNSNTHRVARNRIKLVHRVEKGLVIVPGTLYKYFDPLEGRFFSCKCVEVVGREDAIIEFLDSKMKNEKVNKGWLRSCEVESHAHFTNMFSGLQSVFGALSDDSGGGYETDYSDEEGGLQHEESSNSTRLSPEPLDRFKRCDSPHPNEPEFSQGPMEEAYVKAKMQKELKRYKKGSEGEVVDKEVAEDGKEISGADFFMMHKNVKVARIPKRRVYRIKFAGVTSMPFFTGWFKTRVCNNNESDLEVEIGVLGLYRVRNKVRGWTTNIIIGQHSKVRFMPENDQFFKKFAELLVEGEHEVPAEHFRNMIDDSSKCPFFNRQVNPREPDIESISGDGAFPEGVSPIGKGDRSDEEFEFKDEWEDVECMPPPGESFVTTHEEPFVKTPAKKLAGGKRGIMRREKDSASPAKRVSISPVLDVVVVEKSVMKCDKYLDMSKLLSSFCYVEENINFVSRLMVCPWFLDNLKSTQEVWVTLAFLHDESCHFDDPLTNLLWHLGKKKIPDTCLFFDLLAPIIKVVSMGVFLYIPEDYMEEELREEEVEDIRHAQVWCFILNGVSVCVSRKARKIFFVNPMCEAQASFEKTGRYWLTYVEKSRLSNFLASMGENPCEYQAVSIKLPSTMAVKPNMQYPPIFLLILINILAESKKKTGMYTPVLHASPSAPNARLVALYHVKALDFHMITENTVKSMFAYTFKIVYHAYNVAYALYHKEPCLPYSIDAPDQDYQEDIDYLFSTNDETEKVDEMFQDVSGHKLLPYKHPNISIVLRDRLKECYTTLEEEDLLKHFPPSYLMWMILHSMDQNILDFDHLFKKAPKCSPEVRVQEPCTAFVFPLMET